MLSSPMYEYSDLESLLTIIRDKLWIPDWVSKLLEVADRLHEVDRIVRKLDEIRILMRHLKGELGKITIRFLAERLYEIYCLYIVLKAIHELYNIKEIKRRDLARLMVGTERKGRIEIIYNSPIPCSAVEHALAKKLLSMEEINNEILEKARGRPDLIIEFIDIDGRKRLLLEAKFSATLGYISGGKFKAFSYLYEYNADAAILAFPIANEQFFRRSVYDEEAKASFGLLKAATGEGIELLLRDGKRLYVVPLSPLNEEVSMRILKRILEMTIH